MNLFVLNPHKGFCHDPSAQAERRALVTNGFDQLPWDNHFQFSPLAPVVDDAPKSKRDKRALKRQNAAKRRRDAAPKGQSVTQEVNPYLLEKRLKTRYRNIVGTCKDDVKLFQFHSIAFFRSDLDYILPDEWLNDNDISLVFEMVERLFLKDHAFRHEVVFMAPAVVQLLVHFPVDDLPTILPMDELRKSKFVFIPFNQMDLDEVEDPNSGSHWELCVMSRLNNTLYVYDSMADDEDDEAPLQDLRARLVACKLAAPKLVVRRMKCDQQQNFDDCGVFLIMITLVLVKRMFYDEVADLDIGTVKFDALAGRYAMIKIIEQLKRRSDEADGQLP